MNCMRKKSKEKDNFVPVRKNASSRPNGPREYGSVGRNLPEERFNFEDFPLEWGSFDKYEVAFGDEHSIGKGGFGEVFMAKDKEKHRDFVVKAYRPDREKKIRIQREVKMLELVKHGPNILRLYDMVMDDATGTKMLVFEFKGHPPFKKYFKDFDVNEGKYYFYGLLRALKYTHERGIIHRDIKGGNVLYNPQTREVTLIDWGLADFHRPDKHTESWPGTRGYKAPELLLRHSRIDYSVDIWALGVLLSVMFFRKSPFPRPSGSGKQDTKQELLGVTQVLGADDFRSYCKKYSRPPYNLHVSTMKSVLRDISSTDERMDLHVYNAEVKGRLATSNGINLLEEIMVYDHELRPTVNEVMAHPYFDAVRDGFCPTVPVVDPADDGGESLSSDWSDILY